jgi:hypothetical protein
MQPHLKQEAHQQIQNNLHTEEKKLITLSKANLNLGQLDEAS